MAENHMTFLFVIFYLLSPYMWRAGAMAAAVVFYMILYSS